MLCTLFSTAVASILAQPTIADLDGDGNLEIIIATELGFVYVLNAQTGEVCEFVLL